MENILIKSKKFNLCFFVFINVFLLDYYLPIMLLFRISEYKNEEILHIFSLIYILIVTINRLYLLPFYFCFLLKYTKSQEIKFFIQKLKLSLFRKIILLFSAFFVSPILGVFFDIILNNNYCLMSLKGSFKLGLILTPYIGLYQPYLILFLYWWLENYFKKKNNKIVI